MVLDYFPLRYHPTIEGGEIRREDLRNYSVDFRHIDSRDIGEIKPPKLKRGHCIEEQLLCMQIRSLEGRKFFPEILYKGELPQTD